MQIIARPNLDRDQLVAARCGSGLYAAAQNRLCRIGGIDQQTDFAGVGKKFACECQQFAGRVLHCQQDARNITAGSSVTCRQAKTHWIGEYNRDNRTRVSQLFRSDYTRHCA